MKITNFKYLYISSYILLGKTLTVKTCYIFKAYSKHIRINRVLLCLVNLILYTFPKLNKLSVIIVFSSAKIFENFSNSLLVLIFKFIQVKLFSVANNHTLNPVCHRIKIHFSNNVGGLIAL